MTDETALTREETPLFVTQDALVKLTGASQPATQERILRNWGLNVSRNRLNRVELTCEALIRWQLGQKTPTTDSEPVMHFRRS